MASHNNRLSQPIALHRRTPPQSRRRGPTFIRGKQAQWLKRRK